MKQQQAIVPLDLSKSGFQGIKKNLGFEFQSSVNMNGFYVQVNLG